MMLSELDQTLFNALLRRWKRYYLGNRPTLIRVQQAGRCSITPFLENGQSISGMFDARSPSRRAGTCAKHPGSLAPLIPRFPLFPPPRNAVSLDQLATLPPSYTCFGFLTPGIPASPVPGASWRQPCFN
jgi:hypothetical protein